MFASHSKLPVFNLKTEIKKIMFDSKDRMLPVTSDPELFKLLIANFSQFEKLGKSDVLQIGEVIKRFNRYLEVSFHHEFPFFLILIYRLNKFRNLYDCDELAPFIIKCIKLFEILPSDRIVQTLQLFLDKKDFDVMFGHEEVNSSIFMLLATACKYLLNLSILLKNIRPNNIGTKCIMYCGFLWISVHLKCLVKKETVTRSDIAIWDRSLVQVSKRVAMTKEVIMDLQLGLKFSTSLALPQEHQFTTRHLGCLLADDEFIRPLSHVRDVIIGLQEFIKTEKELLVLIRVYLRAHYTGFLQSTDTAAIGRASVEGTILGTLDEGISFLNSVTELWNAKKWYKGEQNKDFRAECLRWMMLLLSTVRLTDSNAPQLLRKFLSPKRGSIIVDKEYRNSIVQSILEETKKHFPELTVQRFFPLYKAYKIWPILFLSDFLKQYCIPLNVNITDVSWSEFFSEILQRHSNEELQNYVLDFIIRVAASYRKSQRAHDFIPDILQFKVTNLFVTRSEIDESLIEDKFSDFLKEYIRRNNLLPVIMKRIQEIIGLVSNDKETRFHWIILNVLRTEVIPELKFLQDEEDKKSRKQFKDLLKVSVNIVTQKVSWFGDLTPRHRFCWGVISAGCNKLPMSIDTFEWIFPLQSVVSQLGFVFNVYCKSRHLLGQACLLTEQLPQEVANCKCEDVSNLFQWVRKVQNILQKWQDRFLKTTINYDDILMYASNYIAINSLGQAVCAAEYLKECQEIEEVKNTFIICFEQLNCYLIQYVANYPEVKYCNLPELLHNYGINFPSEIKKSIENKVIFPGNERAIPMDQMLSNRITPSTNGKFEPGQEVSLTITKGLLLYDLQKLLEDISLFLEPIFDNVEMLVFFHLHKSEMFKKHLHKRLNDVTIATSSPNPGRTFSLGSPSMRPSLAFAMHDKQPKDEGLAMKTFQKALNSVRELLLKILKGTATYSDIIANDALQLESLNIEKEFGILRKFSDLFKINCEGLDGIRSILELFQFTYHIDQIRHVCEQYGLKKCLEDNTLKTLIMIVEESETEESRAKLTPIKAIDKLAYIKEALCLEEHTNYNCLELFPAVAGSAVFFKNKLLSAHSKNVLNNFIASFEFIAPFMEANISFHDLMRKVTKLDITQANGFKQLETVNDLIRLWFSRAESDTLEKVAIELQQEKNEHEKTKRDKDKLLEDYKQLEEEYQMFMKETEKLVEDFEKQEEQHESEKKKILEQYQENKREKEKVIEDYQQQEEHYQECKKDYEKLLQDHQQQEIEYKREKQKLLEDYQECKRDKERLSTEKRQLEVMTRQHEQSWRISYKDVTMTKEPELGRGAWGSVLVGVFREQRVAVKQLHNIIMNENTLAIMNREINTMSRLRHPNLLLFMGAALDHPSGNPLIITEIMDTSLRTAYEKGQLTQESIRLSVLRDTAAGLNYLHCHPDEIIHRDISSANVLLESRGTNKWRAKLSDFGSANMASKAFTQGPGAIVYSAPELFVSPLSIKSQKQQTTKIDVYSYGVLMCEVMTCQFPDSPEKIRTMLQTISTSCRPIIGQIITECLDEQSNNRPTMRNIIILIDSQLNK